MASPSTERSPLERETLIFPTPEAASDFREHVGEQVKRSPATPGDDQPKEVIAQAVAQQFSQVGEAVNLVREPWLHTQAEHTEAQQLVDIAFARDLHSAIKVARQSPHYPRNLDLFHDVLTGEMYDLLKQEKLNHQSVLGIAGPVIAVVLLTLLAGLLVWVLAG